MQSKDRIEELIKEWAGDISELEKIVRKHFIKNNFDLYGEKILKKLFDECYLEAKKYFVERRKVMYRDEGYSKDKIDDEVESRFINVEVEDKFLRYITSTNTSDPKKSELVRRYLADNAVKKTNKELIVEIRLATKDEFGENLEFPRLQYRICSRTKNTSRKEGLEDKDVLVVDLGVLEKIHTIIDSEPSGKWWSELRHLLGEEWTQIFDKLRDKLFIEAPTSFIFEGRKEDNKIVFKFPGELIPFNSYSRLTPEKRFIPVYKRIRSKNSAIINIINNVPLRIHIIVSPAEPDLGSGFSKFSNFENSGEIFYNQAKEIEREIELSNRNNCKNRRCKVLVFHPKAVDKLPEGFPESMNKFIQLKKIIEEYGGRPHVEALEKYFNTLREIKSTEDQTQDIVHLIAHGEYRKEKGGSVYLPNKKNCSESVTSGVFCHRISGGNESTLGDFISFIFLNVCSGATSYGDMDDEEYLGVLERLILKGNVPSGLGYRWDVRNDAAHVFSKHFYRYLLYPDMELPLAVSHARYQLFEEQNEKVPDRDHTWASVVLVHHE